MNKIVDKNTPESNDERSERKLEIEENEESNAKNSEGAAPNELKPCIHDYNRPFIKYKDFKKFVARDKETESLYGKFVLAASLVNIEYKTRFYKLEKQNNMKPPPRCGRIFPGVIVVRNLGKKGQYETWMPEDVFEEMYKEDS
jgi:hypothetical protein